jgi:hypothetical protein
LQQVESTIMASSNNATGVGQVANLRGG